LNDASRIVEREWQRLAARFSNLRLDTMVVMPNHVHGILVITENVNVGATQPPTNQTCNIKNGSPIPETRAVERMDGATRAPENHSPERMVGSPLPDGPAAQSLGAFIGQFKSRVTKRLHLTGSIWQRNYYEHIIRNEAEWERIRQYIQTNPLRWEQDDEYTPV
jgi:REP element-mobilizing transposase RayT